MSLNKLIPVLAVLAISSNVFAGGSVAEGGIAVRPKAERDVRGMEKLEKALAERPTLAREAGFKDAAELKARVGALSAEAQDVYAEGLVGNGKACGAICVRLAETNKGLVAEVDPNSVAELSGVIEVSKEVPTWSAAQQENFALMGAEARAQALSAYAEGGEGNRIKSREAIEKGLERLEREGRIEEGSKDEVATTCRFF